jgi:hypothetical protein
MKLRDKLDRIRKLYPKGPTSNGQLYSGSLREAESGRWKKVTLYTLFISDENTHLLRPHVFDSQRARSASQWSAWFAKNLRDIHVKAVLPGIGVRTNKSWAVKQILGWAPLHAKHKSNHSRVAKQRNKTKSQRKQNGQVRIRRRHGNRKGKAK